MPGAMLTTASSLMCPHGGTVSMITSNTRAKAGAALVTADDTFLVGGCPFTLPSGTPSPCVKVKWMVAEVRVKVGGAKALDVSSVGLCQSAAEAPQGPVVVSSTQPHAKGQ